MAVPKPTHWIIIFLAAVAVAVADVLLKRASANSSLLHAFRSPWLLGAVGLYLIQIVFFTHAFISGWKLSLIGALSTALYAIIVLTAGVLLYHESLTRTQVIGILLAIGGVLLINWQ